MPSLNHNAWVVIKSCGNNNYWESGGTVVSALDSGGIQFNKDLHAKAKILPVTFLYYEAVSKLMFDVHNQSAPINILKLFTKTSHIHTYNISIIQIAPL